MFLKEAETIQSDFLTKWRIIEHWCSVQFSNPLDKEQFYIQCFTPLFNKCLLITHYVPSTVLGRKKTGMNKNLTFCHKEPLSNVKKQPRGKCSKFRKSDTKCSIGAERKEQLPASGSVRKCHREDALLRPSLQAMAWKDIKARKGSCRHIIQ